MGFCAFLSAFFSQHSNWGQFCKRLFRLCERNGRIGSHRPAEGRPIGLDLFAILYTGGPKPLGYLGLGEALVFFFYGPVATLGTYYILTLQIDPLILYASLPPGLLSCAILIANNLRDEQNDRRADKKTLIVRYARTFGQWEYACTIALAALIPLWMAALGAAPSKWAFCSLIFFAAYPALKRAFTAQSPQELALLLPASAKLLYLYTAFFCIANG